VSFFRNVQQFIVSDPCLLHRSKNTVCLTQSVWWCPFRNKHYAKCFAQFRYANVQRNFQRPYRIDAWSAKLILEYSCPANKKLDEAKFTRKTMDSRSGCLPHRDNIYFYEVQRTPLFEEA